MPRQRNEIQWTGHPQSQRPPRPLIRRRTLPRLPMFQEPLSFTLRDEYGSPSNRYTHPCYPGATISPDDSRLDGPFWALSNGRSFAQWLAPRVPGAALRNPHQDVLRCTRSPDWVYQTQPPAEGGTSTIIARILSSRC